MENGNQETLERVYIAQNIQDAYLMKSLLEENSIDAFLKNEHSAPLAGLIPFGEVYPELWVSSEVSDKAKRIIEEESHEGQTDHLPETGVHDL